jgi:hypothetical protein
VADWKFLWKGKIADRVPTQKDDGNTGLLYAENLPLQNSPYF